MFFWCTGSPRAPPEVVACLQRNFVSPAAAPCTTHCQFFFHFTVAYCCPTVAQAETPPSSPHRAHCDPQTKATADCIPSSSATHDVTTKFFRTSRCILLPNSSANRNTTIKPSSCPLRPTGKSHSRLPVRDRRPGNGARANAATKTQTATSSSADTKHHHYSFQNLSVFNMFFVVVVVDCHRYRQFVVFAKK